jgi:anti-sigma B factor antagonist
MSSETQRRSGGADPRFELDVRPDRERVIVTPAGEVDLATAPRMQSTIDELLERGFTQVVVDLRQVEFMDSQGVRALMTAHCRAHRLDATLSLIVGHGVSRSVLEMAGVLRHLDVTR